MKNPNNLGSIHVLFFFFSEGVVMLSVEGKNLGEKPQGMGWVFDALRQLHVCRIHRQKSNLAPEKRERERETEVGFV